MRAKLSNPYAQIMANLMNHDASRRKTAINKVIAYGDPFRLPLRVSATESISYADAQLHFIFPHLDELVKDAEIFAPMVPLEIGMERE